MATSQRRAVKINGATAMILCGCGLVALVLNASHVQAEPDCGPGPQMPPPSCLGSNEQQFVNDLVARGISGTVSPRVLAGLGWKICGDIQQGRSPEVEANRVYAYNTGLGTDGARDVVAVAVADLCPEATAPHYLPPNYLPTYNLP